MRDLWLRSGLEPATLERLADADAFRSLGLDRREALWAVRGLGRVGDQDDLPLFALSRPERDSEPDAKLPPMPLGAHVVEDYRRLSLSLKAHPVAFMRARLDARGVRRAEALATLKTGDRVAVAGLVLVRQRPGTAQGVIFMTLEDETGIANLIVWPKAFERLRAIVIGARFVVATGKLQNESGVVHLIVERMEDLTPMLGLLSREDPEADRSGLRRSAAARRAAPPRRPLRPDAALLRPAPAADARAARRRPRAAGRAEFPLRRRQQAPKRLRDVFRRRGALVADDHRPHEILAMAQARQRDAGEMDEDKQRQAVRNPGMQTLRARRAPQGVGGQRVAARSRRGDDDQQGDDHRAAGRIMADETRLHAANDRAEIGEDDARRAHELSEARVAAADEAPDDARQAPARRRRNRPRRASPPKLAR